MCKAKIHDHLGTRYKCLRPDVVTFNITKKYNSGHLKGKTKNFVKTLCSHHASKERYKFKRNREKGHIVEVVEILLKEII